MSEQPRTIDGNEAAANIAYALSEAIAIYPITPASPMGELCDEWAAQDRENLWGHVPKVIEMQAEGGAAGAIHGALQAGALSTTFTASQGLLLMLPNMYKIAGELTSAVIHVAARSVATHALSIFGDHSDVMAARQTGFALLASAGVQEAHDMALVAHVATLRARVPFLHFFDGFRTSHELNKIAPLGAGDIRALIDDDLVAAHRLRALSPERPVLRGSAQNPDVFFQAREAVSPFYAATPGLVQDVMREIGARTGRSYRLFDYTGHPEAERVIVIMGSGGATARETARGLAAAGEKVGVVQVRLYRPFSVPHLIAALPPTVTRIAALDRTKEPGSVGEPLYLDVIAALAEADGPSAKVYGGRYGLSSKEFTPAMVKGVFDELAEPTPKRHFTVGIVDDVMQSSLQWDKDFDIEPDDEVRALFYGLGSDGTVSANKSSIKIIGEHTDHAAQAYFVYDSKKAGAMTVSHLRFGAAAQIDKPYLLTKANFIACHHPGFLERFELLEIAEAGATFLLNLPLAPDEVWDRLPRAYQRTIIDKGLTVYTIDATQVAREAGLGRRINTIMQTCFFAISGVLERTPAIAAIKASIEKTYAKRGPLIVGQNVAAVDAALDHLHQVAVPEQVTSSWVPQPLVPKTAPEFVQRVTAQIMAGRGDLLPVSAFPPDGTFPTGTAKFEKRSIASDIPVLEPDLCIQCGKCALVCPHAAILAKAFSPRANGAPEAFQVMQYKGAELPEGTVMTIQTAPDDCTGCALCVEVCPAKDKRQVKRKAINMTPKAPILEAQREAYAYFLELPEMSPRSVRLNTVKGSQLLEPLFTASGACAGCGETPYLKLLTQLFGDRTIVANATGCSSIFGGNLPTTPWSTNAAGRGPAWSNSLFEDNAEFGFGMRVALDQQRAQAETLLKGLADKLGTRLVDEILAGQQKDHAAVDAQRTRLSELSKRLVGLDEPRARQLATLSEQLVPRSMWIVGGDGWAYDIGFGGLDHTLSQGLDVNVLVLDTEVYSNTGGQMSKATPKGAIAKFAAGGKTTEKKDLAMMAMAYGDVYVARVAMGASDAHTVKAFLEAESFPGASLILAYSHCIAHGIPMHLGMAQQKLAAEAGHWPLMRYDPRRRENGENPLVLDSKAPKIPFERYAYNEGRFKLLTRQDPEFAKRALREMGEDARRRYGVYAAIASEQEVK